ncbi:nucleoside/nucleotide kinase family protein [Kitasatospora sp. NBC_00315]|uniref:nucleoside/nucleotide kinase family protein n=1 Tax=Kitasatospora sp. NBC_00315 TaxID=2975963 RepID=UPI0032516EBD
MHDEPNTAASAAAAATGAPGTTDDLRTLTEQVRALLRGRGSGSRTLLGLAGPPGAGKSTLARFLVAEIRRTEGATSAAYLPLDGFHLSNAQLDRLGLRARKGAPNTFDADGYVALLRRVADDRFRDIYVPDFDRELDEPVAARHVVTPQARLVITEGNYLASADHPWTQARPLLRELWYVEAEDSVRETRLLRRHMAGGEAEADARSRVSSNDHPNGEYVKAARDACTRSVRLGDLPPGAAARSVD